MELMELGLKIDVRNPDPGFDRDKDPDADNEMIGISGILMAYFNQFYSINQF